MQRVTCTDRRRFLEYILPVAAVLAAAVSVLFPASVSADDVDDLIAEITGKAASPAQGARRLVAATGQLADAPPVQVRFCKKAVELGMSAPAGYPAALAALDLLGKLAPKQEADWRAKRLELYRLRYQRGPMKDRAANGRAYVKLLISTAPARAEGRTDALIEIVTADARTRAEKAERLVAAADELQAGSKAQAAFYAKALDYGAKTPSGCTHALTAIAALMNLWPDRAAELQLKRVDVLRLHYRSLRKPAARRAAGAKFMPALVALADAWVTQRRAIEATGLYYEAIGVAIYLKSKARATIAGKLKAAEKQVRDEKKLAALRDAVNKAPRDVEARMRLVLFYLHVFDDPASAAKVLTDDLDEATRTYVPLAAKPRDQLTPEQCRELGRWYYTQFEHAPPAGKPVVLRRARGYYERYLAETKDTDLRLTKARLALGEIARHLGKYARNVVIHWTIADDADVYLNGKPLRTYRPSFHTRRDEAYKRFSAKATLQSGDVFTVGGRRGGSYGFLLVALDEKGRTVWQTDTQTWQAYAPADPKTWYLPSVAARSKKTKVTVNPRPWHVQNTMRKQLRVKARSIWPGPGARKAYLVSVVR